LVKSGSLAFPSKERTLCELLLGHLRKNEKKNQHWIVFTAEEEKKIREMTSLFFPKTISTAEVLDALLLPVRKMWSLPFTATYTTKSGRLDGKPTILAIMVN
ncbi:MAG: hypothetical protein Q8Q97_00945, partial [bacterium]|nr:hypothetical protein [bacterium]